MSSRPTPPQPIKRWPFYLGDFAFLAMAAITLASADTPPGLGSILLATACVLLGIGLVVAPYLIDYEGRLRFAEASAREAIEVQVRRVGQTAEQLANAVSRSQSTEEQANQALGTLEELSEKLGTQAEDLSQLLAKINTREQETLRAEIQEITRERDEKLAALADRITMVADAVGENRAATKRATAATAEALTDVHRLLDRIALRVESLSIPSPETLTEHGNGAVSTESAATNPPVAEPPPPVSEPEPIDESDRPGEPASTSDPEPEVAVEPAPTEADAEKEPDDEPRAGTKPRGTRQTAEPTRKKAAPRRQATESMELALDADHGAKKQSRRDTGPATSIVATAYIGIGNKLYLRGEGPGLSWDEGIPMQFLAIGKWGWTTTEADGQIVCRIFRNDETPMLDEDIIVPAGSKTEVTPRF